MKLGTLSAATLAAALLTAAPPAGAQSATLLLLREGVTLQNRFRVDSSGAFVAYGFVRDVGGTTGCAAQLPISGAGTWFLWHPCRGSVRFGRVPTGQTSWDDANMNDFTFAGGNQVTASGYGAFAYGDQVTVSSTAGVGFGSGVTVSGTGGFGAGASNVCSGFACVAIGYLATAGGQGSVALGYRVTANNDYSVALGYRASNNAKTGTMVMGDQSSTDSVRNQNNNEFRARYAGGFRLRTSAAANSAPGVSGNTGCDLPAGSGSWTCSSSRTLKENFAAVDGEAVLLRLRATPVTTWSYIAEGPRVRHLGPVAEDFRAAFGLGVDGTSIGLGDIDGVNFAAAQALEARTAALRRQLDEKSARVEALEAELAATRRLLAELGARVARLEQR